MCYHINVYNYCCPHAKLVYCHHCYYWKQWHNEEEELAYYLFYWCTYAIAEGLKPNMGGGATMLVMMTYTHTYCSHHLNGLMRFLDCATTKWWWCQWKRKDRKHKGKEEMGAPFGNGWPFFLHIFLLFVLLSPNTLRSRPF